MTPTANVLIVEDQHDIAANIWDFLERRGYEVDHAADGASGLMHAMRGNFDVIVLDLGLPRLDGLDLCRRLREAGRGTPVLMLTARDTLDDKLKGFAEGADDYMVKPFELKELEARIRALLRHARPATGAALAVGELCFDPASMIATRAGRSIPLTRAQAAILELLLRRAPGVVTQHALMEQVWPRQDGDARALHTHIYELRVLVDKPFDRGLIQTVHGIGYRLVGGDA
jgi:DNA-binding response OmpR family regulator